MSSSKVKTNISIRFAFPGKIKSSPSRLACCLWQYLVLLETAKKGGLSMHWSSTGGLGKKGKNYWGCLTLGGGVQASAASSLYPYEGLCSASGAGERRGNSCAPCRNPRQPLDFIRGLLGVPASGSPLPLFRSPQCRFHEASWAYLIQSCVLCDFCTITVSEILLLVLEPQ